MACMACTPLQVIFTKRSYPASALGGTPPARRQPARFDPDPSHGPHGPRQATGVTGGGRKAEEGEKSYGARHARLAGNARSSSRLQGSFSPSDRSTFARCNLSISDMNASCGHLLCVWSAAGFVIKQLSKIGKRATNGAGGSLFTDVNTSRWDARWCGWLVRRWLRGQGGEILPP
jgi:hypothetical protein